MTRVIVVGAGISGLTLAYRLSRMAPGLSITVLERLARPGGTIWTERREGFQVEIGPNGFLDTKPSTLALCRGLGLGDQLIPASESSGRNRYLFFGDGLRLLPRGFASFLRSDLLSWRGKLDLLLERFRRRRAEGTDESVAAFVRRRAGREAEMLADAFVTGIHAGDSDLLSVQAAFPRLVALEQTYGSVLKGFRRAAAERRAAAAAGGEAYEPSGRVWSFREGLRVLVERLRDVLIPPPLFGVAVRRIVKEPDPGAAWSIKGEGHERWVADAVVLTCPAQEQAALLADLDPPLAEKVAEIPSSAVAVVALGYRQSDVPVNLDGFGFLAPQRLRRDMLGVQWCSSIFPERAPAGMVLLRAMCGGWNRPEIMGWPDLQLLGAVRAEISKAMRIVAAPVFHEIIRWPRAIPQYHLGHSERVAWIDQRVSRHPGIFLGGNCYRGVALNDCTEQAELLAQQVKRYLDWEP